MIADGAMKLECSVHGSRYQGSPRAGNSATGPSNLQDRQSWLGSSRRPRELNHLARQRGWSFFPAHTINALLIILQTERIS